MINTDTIPFKTFCILIDDSSRCVEFGIDLKEWEEFKKKYQEENLSPEGEHLLESYKQTVKASTELSRAVMLYTSVLGIPGSWQPYFEKAGIRYTGDKEKDFKYLETLTQKSKTKEEIFSARLLKLEKEISERADKELKEEFDLKRINEAIASLEIHGFNIPNYEELTLGKYEAMTEVIKKKSNGK